jgi:hypothetical protein
MTIKRIRWNPITQRMLAEKAVELLKNNTAASDIDAVRRAMKFCLPQAEWRDLTTLGEV